MITNRPGHLGRTAESSSKRNSSWENWLTALKCVNRIYISGRHGVPAAMTVCQKSAARKATTIMRRIRPRVSAPKVLSWEVGRWGSLMRNYSVARQRADLTRHW